MDNTAKSRFEKDIAEIAADAQQLLASGYIEAITAEQLADFTLEAQFAMLDADEPGGACSWSEARCKRFYERAAAAYRRMGIA